MKKLSLLIALVLGTLCANAQMAYWCIQPKYEKMEMALENALLETDSLGTTSVWTKDGRKLYSTEDVVKAFAEDKAVITTGNGKILGYLNQNGQFKSLPDGTVAYNYPYFSDGLLCVVSGRGYGYFDGNSEQSNFLFFDKAYPFFEGYASYMSYKQPDKKKDPYFNFNVIPGKTVNYEIAGKKFDYHDIDFLSSVAPDGRAVAIIKGKVFWFDAKTGSFSMMCGGGIEDKRNQVSVDDKVIATLSFPTNKLRFNGKYGKNVFVSFSFDNMLRPDTIILDDRAITFPSPKTEPYKYSSPLTVTSEGGLKGLNYNGQPLLPPQFEDISLVYDDYAIAKLDGKWGLLKALPNVQYSFVVNNGKDIGFRHETFETQIRLDLPKEIASASVDFDVPADYGMKLDKRFMDARDTRAGNFLMYNCVLTIPEDLPSALTDITYPVDITFNDLRLFTYPLKVRAWHLKSYNVDIDNDEVAIKDGRATFTIDISSHRNIGEPDYPFTVQAKSDNLHISSEKISETRYKYSVDALQTGVNHIDIYVTEKGCPSAVFPLEINYSKPTRNGKESVEVKKKEEAVSDEPQTQAPAQAEEATQPQPQAPAAETPSMNQPVTLPNTQQSQDRYVPEQTQPVQQQQAQPVQQQPTQPVQQPQQQSTPNDSIKDANLMRFIKVM